MSDKNPKAIPIKNIVSEDGAHELATSPDMQPYLRLIKAGLQNRITTWPAWKRCIHHMNTVSGQLKELVSL